MKGLSQRITIFSTFKAQTHQQANHCTSHSRGCHFTCMDVVLTGQTACLYVTSRLCFYYYCFASSSKTDTGSHTCVLLLVSDTWAAISSGPTLPPCISTDLSARLSHGFWTQTWNLPPSTQLSSCGSSSQLLALQTLEHYRREHLRELAGRTSLAFTLRGQWKFVAAVFLLSLSQATTHLGAPMGPQVSDCEILSDAMEDK